MIYYLNRGFIVEQALVDVIHRYLDQLRLDNIYQNFHISVTNQHPFAHMMIDENARAADVFPSVVITSQNDGKVPDLMNVPPQVNVVSVTSSDIDEICNTKRVKTIFNETTGEEKEVTRKDGSKVYENIPGVMFVANDSLIEELKKKADEKGLYGLSYVTRRRDKISVEIWSENNQLKNEIFEHLRLLLSSSMEDVLKKTYKDYDPVIFDTTVNGERSNNFNLDFDVILYGSHISFDIDYNVQQIILDDEIEKITDVIPEVMNHVKENGIS